MTAHTEATAPAANPDFVSRLRRIADRSPDAVALIEETGSRASFREFVDRISRIEAALSRQGMRRGDRVLFAIRPSETAIAAILAITKLGAVVVAAPIGAGATLFEAQMRSVAPAWVLAESFLLAAMQSGFVRWVVRARGGLLPSLASLDTARWIASGPWVPGLGRATRLEMLEREANREVLRDASRAPQSRDQPGAVVSDAAVPRETEIDDDDAFIVFSSGSTAAPKAVVHSFASLAATIDVVAERLTMAPGDRLYARDLHLVLPALLAGATAYVPRSGRFSPPSCVEALRRHGITHLFEVTANLQALVTHLESIGATMPSTVRQVMVGAAPVRRAFFERLSRVLPHGAEAWCVYGMTEMLPVATIELRDKLAYTGMGDIVGHPVRGVSVSIGDSGELVVRGPHLFSHYLGSAPSASHATGDLARIEPDGQLVLTGRAKDMIIRGEYNIYPELHEPTIEAIDGVARCALVGLFDEHAADETVVLVIEPSAPSLSERAQRELVERVRRELRDGTHRIDDAAQPDHIMIATLPVTMRSGKVDKAAVRALARQRLA